MIFILSCIQNRFFFSILCVTKSGNLKPISFRFRLTMASGAQPGSLVPPRTNSTLGVIPGLRIPDDPKVERCAHVDTHYNLTVAGVWSVYIIFGLLYTFFGE